jgi:hypothetical protein
MNIVVHGAERRVGTLVNDQSSSKMGAVSNKIVASE